MVELVELLARRGWTELERVVPSQLTDVADRIIFPLLTSHPLRRVDVT
ncbi:hypothetical protein ACIRRA_42930 [Nocardia sp. NPDC101769]